MSDESEIRQVLALIDTAWRTRRFDDLDDCFDEHAVIVGPDHVALATGRPACVESYREFASNAQVIEYVEDGQSLRIWENVAVYTFRWRMTWRRDGTVKTEEGSDQYVLRKAADGWRAVWRCVRF